MRFLYMNAGEAFNARGLAVSLEVSQPAISKALPPLEKQGFIGVIKDKRSKRLAIKLNRESPLVVGMKRADNLLQLYETGLAGFLKETFPGCAVIVFGSFARGEDTGKSDIDIAVVGTKDTRLDSSRFGKMLSKEVNINFFQSFKDISKELKGNIMGGILLSGWIEL